MTLADVKVGRVNGDKDFQSDSLAQRVNTVDRNVAIAKALLYHLPEQSASTTTPASTAATATTTAAVLSSSSSSSDNAVSDSNSSTSSTSGSTITTAATATGSARNITASTDGNGSDVAQHGVRRSVLPRALCFCASVQHAVDLAATLSDHGKSTTHYHTVHLHTTSPHQRNDVMIALVVDDLPLIKMPCT
jgi:hypothetical protein